MELDEGRAADAFNKWSVDLTSCSKPLATLSEPQKDDLRSLLTEVANNTDSKDRGWSITERLQTFFESSDAGRNDVEEAIKELGIQGKIKIHYNAGVDNDPFIPRPAPTESFHPAAAHLGYLMKRAGGERKKRRGKKKKKELVGP